MKFVLFVIFLFLSVQTFSQRIVSITPYGTKEDDEIIKVISTSDKGHLITAYTQDYYYLMKFDSNYDSVWTKKFYDNVLPFDIIETYNHDFFAAGIGPTTPWTFSISGNGDSLKAKKFYQWKTSNTYFKKVIQLSDSTLLLTLYRSINGNNLLQLSIQGDSINSFPYNPSLMLPIQDSFIISNGSYFKKITNGGSLVLDKTIKLKHGTGNILPLKEGGYLLFGNGVGLSKINANGDSLWSKFYTESATVATGDVKQTLDSGFLVFGTIYDNFYLLKTDKSGNKQWSYRFINPFNKEVANYISLNCDSSICLFGYTDFGPIGGKDISIAKMDSMKNVYGSCVLRTGIEAENYENKLLNIYPNPSHDLINISATSNLFLKIVVMNSLGQTILEENGQFSNRFSLSIKDIPPGIYVMHLTDNNRNRTTRKFIKY